MLDWIGSYELLFILILAGIVMGPQRIAQFARWLGKTTAYLQNISRGFAAQLKNELDAIDDGGDMQDMLSEMRSLQKEVNSLRQQINETATAAITQTKETAAEAKDAVEQSIRPPTFEEDEADNATPVKKISRGQNGSTPPATPPPPPSLPKLKEVPDDEE